MAPYNLNLLEVSFFLLWTLCLNSEKHMLLVCMSVAHVLPAFRGMYSAWMQYVLYALHITAMGSSGTHVYTHYLLWIRFTPCISGVWLVTQVHNFALILLGPRRKKLGWPLPPNVEHESWRDVLHKMHPTSRKEQNLWKRKQKIEENEEVEECYSERRWIIKCEDEQQSTYARWSALGKRQKSIAVTKCKHGHTAAAKITWNGWMSFHICTPRFVHFNLMQYFKHTCIHTCISWPYCTAPCIAVLRS